MHRSLPLQLNKKRQEILISKAGFFYEADSFQYSQGLMTEPVWQAKLRAMEINLKRCEYLDIYELRSELVETGFKKILDSMPSQCER